MIWATAPKRPKFMTIKTKPIKYSNDPRIFPESSTLYLSLRKILANL
jgi:hypothetical protein